MTRFWVPRTGAVDLSDGGFLADPTQMVLLRRTEPPLALPDLESYRALALLGEPGVGKSTTLEAEDARIRSSRHQEGAMSVHVDLRAFSSEGLLVQKVFANPEIAGWKSGTSQLFLHLDSLDEALLRIDSIANLIASELQNLPTERLSVRIACRTAVWPEQTLEPALREIWGDEAVGVFELAPLRRVDVDAAAKARAIDQKAFFEELYHADVVPFAIKPLTLNLLLGLFERDGRLPHSVSELYILGCRKLCEEQNPSRRDSRKLGRLNPDQRLRLASRLAAVTMLANRYAIWTGAETDLFPESDVALSKLSLGLEEGDFRTFSAEEPNIREVLDTGLFSHPSGGLTPQLSNVAAWAASLSKEIRKGLISQEPLALLKGDLANWDAEDRADLTNSLLTAFDRQRIHDFIPGITNAYGRLAHPGLAAQVQAYITDNTKNVQARRAACLIAEACEVKALQPELLRAAVDVSEDPWLRARATSALRNCGDNSIAGQLMPLAKGELLPDPMDDLKGYALEFLWPKYIGANELFSMLTAPNEGNFGAYAMFLTHSLPESLGAADLPAALHWANDFVGQADVPHHDFHRKSLSDAIFVKVWREFEHRPDLTQPFVDHVFKRLKDGGELFKGTDARTQRAYFADLESNTRRRRAFLLAASRRVLSRECRAARVQVARHERVSEGRLCSLSRPDLAS